jgi:uncharacterized protein (TIRG00374 family)
MDRRRILMTGVVLVILAVLVYLQVRTWSHFDWHRFREARPRLWLHIAHGVALTYLAYALRAVRWKIFLRPVRPETRALDLFGPTLVGFTGLALLGRPGEFIRPYLIARRVDLPVSSQIAVWAVERIFDIGAFAVLLVAGIFLPTALAATPHPEYRAQFQEAGFAIMGIVVCLAVGAAIVARKGEALAAWLEDRLGHLSSNLGHRIAQKVREFGAGLNTIHGPVSLLSLIVVSLGMWYMIALAYQEVTHSFGVASLEIRVSQVLLLMGSSMIGSMVQLPGVGGGSQLATIAMLNHVFDVPPELSASCGITLWLVTFVAVVPLGLLLAHRERLSLRQLSEESAAAEEE